jgi:beta-glucosidase
VTFSESAKNLISLMTIEEKISQLSHESAAIQRLGIQSYNHWNEGLHGVARAGIASVFPQAIGLAATFNANLVKKMATIIGTEARAKFNQARKNGGSLIYQGITIWSPNINIFRDPRWGRGQETYGEDPLLTSIMGTMYVKGIQKKNQQGYRLADATIKHFFAHSGPEQLRHQFNAIISKKDMEETYLYAFKEIIKNASPAGVMGAYNQVNGELPCGSDDLLKKLLRKRLKFKGYVVSDCWAINDFHNGHRVTKNPVESASKAINAGCDLACGDSYQHLYDAKQQDLIDEKTIDISLQRLYISRYRLGMFDKACDFNHITHENLKLKTHKQTNLRLAEEGIILLKNDGILPLNEHAKQKIAIIGHNANNFYALYGNYHGTPENFETIYQGLCKAYPHIDFRYAQGSVVDHDPQSWEYQPINEAKEVANWADIIVMILGIDSTLEGEENDASKSSLNGDKSTLMYLLNHRQLIDEMSKFSKPMILINVSGSAMIFPTDKFNAIVQQFYGGEYAGRALAHVLFGKTNPSGHLPITLYEHEHELPSFDDYSMMNRTYKFFKGSVLFPFGYGLSYSHFQIEVSSCSLSACELVISNLGPFHGNHVTLIYASYPGEKNAPKYNLVGFSKIFLKVSDHRKIKVNINNIDLYDEHGDQYLPDKVLLHVTSSHPDYDNNSITKEIINKRS